MYTCRLNSVFKKFRNVYNVHFRDIPQGGGGEVQDVREWVKGRREGRVVMQEGAAAAARRGRGGGRGGGGGGGKDERGGGGGGGGG